MEFVCKNPECPRYAQRDYYSSVSVVMRDGEPFCKQSPCPACGKIREEIKKEKVTPTGRPAFVNPINKGMEEQLQNGVTVPSKALNILALIP